MGKLVIYKASAGSGKTFTLAVEYMKLLVENPTAYRKILAVTFTNKATGEMKERILSQLYGIANGDADSRAYINRICDDLKLEPQTVRERAAEALTRIVHDYSRFQVATIDSFFQVVMRNLARELGLGASMNIELDSDKTLFEAVDCMIEPLDEHSPIFRHLLDYTREVIKEGKSWNVIGTIKQFGKKIFSEEFLTHRANLHEKLKNPQFINKYKKQIQEKQKEAVALIDECVSLFLDTLQREGLNPEDLKSGKSGIAGYYSKLKKGEYEGKGNSPIRNKTVEAHLESPANWGTKSDCPVKLGADTADALHALLQRTEEIRQKIVPIVNSCKLALRRINDIALLAAIDEQVHALNQEHNRFLLAETNILLRELIQDDDSSFVFEKIGSNISHVMIDEFQDTSSLQWKNFRMLLSEGLSTDADSLIVGDVKQAIYRWRNGDWSILSNLQGKLGPSPIVQRELKVNRRSEKNIITFNNALFTSAIEVMDGMYTGEREDGRSPLQKAYSDVEQESPDDKNPPKGYVKVEFLEGDNNEEYSQSIHQALVEEVEALMAQGVKLSQIVILVRKNKFIPPIASYFEEHLPQCPIVSNEAFYLKSSAALQLLIEAVRYLAAPTDLIPLTGIVTRCAQLGILPQESTIASLLHPTTADELLALLPEGFRDRQNELRQLPLYELLEQLLTLFGLDKMAGEAPYYFAFLDAVLEYLKRESSDLDSFLKYWDETLSKKTIPAGEVEGLRIYTIHQSKGLEFHTVLLPYANWNLETEQRIEVWCHPTLPPYSQMDLLPISYGTSMANSVFRNDYLKEQLELWVDNLNVLYVALTRASKNLFIYGQHRPALKEKNKKGAGKEEKTTTISHLIEEALRKMQDGYNPDLPYTFGKLVASDEKSEKKVTNLLVVPPQNLLVPFETFDCEVEFRQSNRSSDFIRETEETPDKQAEYIRQGLLLHQIFSEIETADDLDRVLLRLEMEGVLLPGKQTESVRKLITRALTNPTAARWFAPGLLKFNERSIIQLKGNEMEVRRPDRVVITPDRKHVTVIDFKFGRPNDEYKRQVANYMSLLSRMGYPHVEGYLWYVYTGKIEPVPNQPSLF